MIHFSCDLCHRALDPRQDLRYVVKLEAYAAMEPLDCEEIEDDRDHLLEVHEILEHLDDEQDELIGEDIYVRRQFDLCPDCYRKFNKNPLGREAAAQMNFSQN